MKILFIAPYRESTGWGEACRRLILDLNKKYDVVTRCVKLGTRTPEINSEIKSLESKSLDGLTHVVQCVLPHALEYFPGVKNIAAPFIDTVTVSNAAWLEKLKMMDKIWLFNRINLKGNIQYLSVPPKKIDTSLPKIKLAPDGVYKFYFIGEFNRRKNIATLLDAFHSEFNPWEPVELVLKLNHPQMNSAELQKEFSKLSSVVKSNLRIRKMEDYKKEIVITDYLNEAGMDRLHLSCDCFVTASFGEAWCLPAQDANTAHNFVIGTQHGVPITTSIEHCTGVLDTFDGIMTAKDFWLRPSTISLRGLMRDAFENKLQRKFVDYNNDYESLLNE